MHTNTHWSYQTLKNVKLIIATDTDSSDGLTTSHGGNSSYLLSSHVVDMMIMIPLEADTKLIHNSHVTED